MVSVCSPSPVVLMNKTKTVFLRLFAHTCRSFSWLDKSSSQLCMGSGLLLLPFLVLSHSSNKRRMARRAHAFARPDCVEYKKRKDNLGLTVSDTGDGTALGVASAGPLELFRITMAFLDVFLFVE